MKYHNSSRYDINRPEFIRLQSHEMHIENLKNDKRSSVHVES